MELYSLIFLTILWLVFLEGLLSADNALVLAMLVRHLPKAEQKRALRYGIWGAFAFRGIAVAAAGILLKFSILKVIGGGYLLYLALAHFLSRGGDQDDAAKAGRFGSGFWGTVISVELADIAFSIDSILAAVAMAEGLPKEIGWNLKFFVVLTGGVLGIVTMRFVAGYFILLLERFKGLEAGAYGLVAWIGLKLVAAGLHTAGHLEAEIDEKVFWGVMIAIVLLSLIFHPKRSADAHSAETAAAIDAVTRMAGGDDSSWVEEPPDAAPHNAAGEPNPDDEHPVA